MPAKPSIIAWWSLASSATRPPSRPLDERHLPQRTRAIERALERLAGHGGGLPRPAGDREWARVEIDFDDAAERLSGVTRRTALRQRPSEDFVFYVLVIEIIVLMNGGGQEVDDQVLETCPEASSRGPFREG